MGWRRRSKGHMRGTNRSGGASIGSELPEFVVPNMVGPEK